MKKITLSSSQINAVKTTLDSMHDNLTVECLYGDYDPEPVIESIEKGLFHQAAEWAICSYLVLGSGSVDVDAYITDLIDDFEFIAES
jgi:hypothetical protein